MEKLYRSILEQVSNDARLPLTPLLTMLPLVRERQTEREAKEMIDVCIRNVEFLSDYLDRMLKSTVLLSGNVAVNIKPLQVGRILKEIEEFYNNKKLKISTEEANVMADENRLKEVMMNLIDNSIRYCEGDVKVIVTVGDETAVTVSNSFDGTTGDEDTGIRICKELCRQMGVVFKIERKEGSVLNRINLKNDVNDI